MAAMQDMMTSDIELKSFMSVKQALPKEFAETQYKPSAATQKKKQKSMSGLRKAIRAIFKRKDKVAKILTPKQSGSAQQIKSSRSGFYTHFGQPTYFGTRLYQPNELAPEEGIFGEWLELGYGETSSTRLVKVMPDGRLSAAKIVYNHHPEDEFRNELDAHHLVQGHPSFPEIIGVVHQSPFRCILQEFVGNESIPENITLEDALRNNKVNISDILEKDWLQIGQDICQGLQHLHDQGYIHQDLSPDSILLYATDGNWRCWRAKICDLGNCTFAKLTPEGIKGQAQLAMAADVHSLGKIFKLVGKGANVHFLKSIGKKCSRRNPKNRPQMDKVCKMLSKF
ncbi:uncharacterized protein [Asterias amurensis]|uniref:uncharacterized protein isoform X1 n=1 Tax=Asterias amurensis TaxID=7602 RepID=UPI003AB570AE